ncbi:MAG: efflux RND transporter periplasmic adaptor subunit [Proteobacteria bacterium]|nr:efflux RND transporter periplasmic adaptor subunit [Pseudomonadota bacterium]
MNVPMKVLWVLLLAAFIDGCSKTPPDLRAAEETAKPEAERSGSQEVQISPEEAKEAGIEVQAAGPTRIREHLTLYGSIKTNQEREQEVRARYPGVVRSVAKRAGDTISKGDELLTVESNESLQVYSIRSPMNGRVLERHTNPGESVDGNTVLMKVADLSSVWAEFAVFARDLSQVRPGMRVLVSGADADDSIAVTLSYVAPAGQADSQSVVARAIVNNQGGRWVPGEFITGELVVTDAPAAVAVKATALQELEGKTTVFVQNERGFEPRAVQVGRRSRDAVEILKGLAAGERYAVTNSYLIKADLMKGEADED